MGKSKWTSKKSRRKGVNARAPATATSQASGATFVHWTPVFARGKVKIYLCDVNGDGPEKLTTGEHAARFVRDVLPGLLHEMAAEHGWTRLPRTVVHDKASYFASPSNSRLQADYARSLRAAGFRSWLGDGDADTTWLAPRLGDFYPHETLISHIRRLMSHKFAHKGGR